MPTLVVDTETRGLRPELGEQAFAVATAWLHEPGRVRVHRIPGDEAAILEELGRATEVLGHNVGF